MRWEDSEFFPVFGDGAPGNLGASLLQDVDHLLVGQRSGGIFPVHQLNNRVLDCLVGNLFPIRGFESGSEEVFHLERAARRLHVLAGDGSTHGRFVNVEHDGNLRHGQQTEMWYAMGKKILLNADDLVGDA